MPASMIVAEPSRGRLSGGGHRDGLAVSTRVAAQAHARFLRATLNTTGDEISEPGPTLDTTCPGCGIIRTGNTIWATNGTSYHGEWAGGVGWPRVSTARSASGPVSRADTDRQPIVAHSPPWTLRGRKPPR